MDGMQRLVGNALYSGGRTERRRGGGAKGKWFRNMRDGGIAVSKGTILKMLEDCNCVLMLG